MDALSTPSSSASSSSSSTSTMADHKSTPQPYAWKSMADSNARYRLKILGGPGSDPKLLRPLNVNDDSEPMIIDTDEFHGYVTFRIKDIDKVHGYAEGQLEDGIKPVPNSKWFDLSAAGTKSKNRNNNCLRFGGRFKREWPGDQIIFVAEFDRRIERLPPCTSAAIKVLRFLDPAVEIDLCCDKPYIRSPLMVTMNLIHASPLTMQDQDAQTKTAEGEKFVPPWTSPNGEHVLENTRLLFEALEDPSTAAAHPQKTSSTTPAPAPAAQVSAMYDFEFTSAGPYVDFANFKLKVAGFSIDLLRFWDGQPGTMSVRTADSSVTFFTLVMEPVPVKEA